jgi:hypothetical protein
MPALSQQNATTSCATAIPPALRKELSRQLPAVHPVEEADLHPDLRKWWRANGEYECPGVVVADFNGDGLVDFGLLLADGDGHVTKNLLVAALQRPKQKWEIVALASFGERAGNFFIRVAAPGTYTEWDKSRAIKASSWSLESVLFESSTQVFIWKDGKFVTVNLSD